MNRRVKRVRSKSPIEYSSSDSSSDSLSDDEENNQTLPSYVGIVIFMIFLYKLLTI